MHIETIKSLFWKFVNVSGVNSMCNVLLLSHVFVYAITLSSLSICALMDGSRIVYNEL